LISLRLGGDDLPRRLLAGALEWSAERLGTVVGGCALLSPRREPIAWAWGSAHADRADELAPVAERLQHRLFPPGAPSALARRAEADPSQPPLIVFDRKDVPGCGQLLARHGIAPPLLVVLRVDGRVAGLVWLARNGGGAEPSPHDAESDRVLRLAQPLLELALRDRWHHGGPGAASGGDLSERGLSPREDAVARLAVQGLGNGAIALRLGVAEHTVKNHMTRVLTKCGVRTRTQLIALFGRASDHSPGS
jgi:DNA-binding CsgD family transcriptional regulator